MKSYDEFVALREDGTKSVADIMRTAKERKLFEKMTVNDIDSLH